MPFRLAVAACLLSSILGSARAADSWFESNRERLLELYRHLHANPELSFQEFNTAKRIADELRKAGAEVTEGVGKMGVVGVLRNGPGPVLLIRSDLDALPVTEATGLAYASKAVAKDDDGDDVGVMHACGHDVHMTCLVGVANKLAQSKNQWSGTVVFIGQHAEEKIGGARKMLDDGLYRRFPKPDFALALHVAHDLETGKIGYTSGPALASSTSIDLKVRGKGGHGAMPHNTIDPIVLSAALILDMQTIVSREINPTSPAVVTVGSIRGGSKHNIIPPEVDLQLTIRSYREDVNAQLIEGITRRANGLAQAHRAPSPSIVVKEGTPPTINTPSLVAKVVPLIGKELGASNLVETEPTMGAEDFGLFSREGVPIFMFRLGTVPAERVKLAREGGETLPSLHSPFYAPDPAPSLETGIRAMSAAALGLLGGGR